MALAVNYTAKQWSMVGLILFGLWMLYGRNDINESSGIDLTESSSENENAMLNR
jgi:hypothetical protein